METCLTPLPDVKDKKDVAGGGPLAKFPARVTAIPPRIASGTIPNMTPEKFKEDTKLWEKRVSYYQKHLVPPLAHGRYRNIMDMNAGLGGLKPRITLWVSFMSVVLLEHIRTGMLPTPPSFVKAFDFGCAAYKITLFPLVVHSLRHCLNLNESNLFYLIEGQFLFGMRK